MIEINITQDFKDELGKMVTDAVNKAMQIKSQPDPLRPHIKGIHALAKFLGVSAPRAQKLKNEGVFTYFQNGRLVLFDPDKVREEMANYNQKRKSKKNG